VPVPATATLSWSAPAAAAVTGYRVYYGTAPGVYLQAPGSGISIGAATTYTLSGIQRGPAYYFAVTAVDAAGNESPYSNEVMKMIQ
jgi:fibronectin type 3 domain-containing protein